MSDYHNPYNKDNYKDGFYSEDSDTKPDNLFSRIDSAEKVEQISKGFAVGKKEVFYEDDRNVISVIISAISVRINMPRGTVKVLMACFAALLAVAVIYGVNVLRDWSTSYYETAEYQKTVDDIKYCVIEGAGEVRDIDLSRVMVLPQKEVVISGNYSFTVPAGYFEEPVFTYGEFFMNMQAYGFYNAAGDYFLVRSYITREGVPGSDMQTVVLDRLKDAEDVRNIRVDSGEFEFGRLITCRYEAYAKDEPDIFAVEYSWQDDDGTICSLDISSESGDYEETEGKILESVHRSGNGLSNDELIARDKELYPGDYDDYPDGYDPEDPVGMGEADPYAGMEPDIDEIRKQEAMEAWDEYNQPEQDISDGIIKP